MESCEERDAGEACQRLGWYTLPATQQEHTAGGLRRGAFGLAASSSAREFPPIVGGGVLGHGSPDRGAFIFPNGFLYFPSYWRAA